MTNTAPTGGDQVVAFAGTHGERQDLKVRVTRVGPRYFATLGVPVLEGREFADQDRENAPKVVVVNDVLARRLASNLPVTGGTLVVRGEPHRIVGVVKDAQYYPGGQVPDAVAYRSYWQPNEAGMFGNDSRTVVRVAGDAGAMMTAIRREVVAADASVPISEDYPLISRVIRVRSV